MLYRWARETHSCWMYRYVKWLKARKPYVAMSARCTIVYSLVASLTFHGKSMWFKFFFQWTEYWIARDLTPSWIDVTCIHSTIHCLLWEANGYQSLLRRQKYKTAETIWTSSIEKLQLTNDRLTRNILAMFQGTYGLGEFTPVVSNISCSKSITTVYSTKQKLALHCLSMESELLFCGIHCGIKLFDLNRKSWRTYLVQVQRQQHNKQETKMGENPSLEKLAFGYRGPW